MDLFDNFYEWVKGYTHTVLDSNIEKEVEVKFVIPLFQKLGYPDECRRQEFYIKSHKKSGARGHADFVYFSESERKYQNENNSLVIVETKKLAQNKLEEAIIQVADYGAKLKTPLLVVTNGFDLKIIQRTVFGENEVILETNIKNLKNYREARSLYECLSFSKVQELKQTLSDPIKHNQFLQQRKLLSIYPEILTRLNQDTFEPEVKREKNKITVTRTKVSIICELPQLFYEGSCQITFSRPFLHGMSFTLLDSCDLKFT